MSETIYAGKIRSIKLKGKYIVILSERRMESHKDHFAVEMSQAVGYRMNGENITFYFKNLPILNLEINKDLIDETSAVLKKVFPMEELPVQTVNLFE